MHIQSKNHTSEEFSEIQKKITREHIPWLICFLIYFAYGLAAYLFSLTRTAESLGSRIAKLEQWFVVFRTVDKVSFEIGKNLDGLKTFLLLMYAGSCIFGLYSLLYPFKGEIISNTVKILSMRRTPRLSIFFAVLFSTVLSIGWYLLFPFSESDIASEWDKVNLSGSFSASLGLFLMSAAGAAFNVIAIPIFFYSVFGNSRVIK